MRHLGDLLGVVRWLLTAILLLTGSMFASTMAMKLTSDTSNEVSPTRSLIGERGIVEAAASSEASTVSLVDSSTRLEDARRSERVGEDRKDDPPESGHKRQTITTTTTTGLSSRDVLHDPGLIPARLVRRAETSGNADYPSREDTSGNAEKNVQSIDPPRSGRKSEDDLGLAEDRHRPRYPYWYRGQAANQRYPVNDRRQHYHNYLRYPVFPGR